jgi:hypothetical protein
MNQILEQLLIGYTKEILTIVQRFLKKFFGHLDLIVKVLSTIDHLSVLMAYIYTGVMIGSYLLWLFFYANNGIFPLAFTIINK